MHKSGFVLVAISALVFGCNGAVDVNGSPGPAPEDADAGSGGGGDGGGGEDPDTPPIDDTCGGLEATIELIELIDPPDMLVVLDKSGSMGSSVDGTVTGDSKWQVMEDALNALTTEREDEIRFGLSVFPTDDYCGVAPGALVNPDLTQAQAIADQLADLAPDGNTPANLALDEALATYNSLAVNDAGRYVLFATDGMPNCDSSGTVEDKVVSAVEALATAGIKTFVLGYGSGIGTDPQVLNDAAVAGGTAIAGGPPYFYQADDANELSAVLAGIASTISEPSCAYELTELPPDPDKVTVLADGNPVDRDTTQAVGWDYAPDESTITFFGATCDAIKAGEISNVEFVFGCSPETVE